MQGNALQRPFKRAEFWQVEGKSIIGSSLDCLSRSELQLRS